MERAGNKSHCPCRACPCLQIQPHSINFALLSWLATNSASLLWDPGRALPFHLCWAVSVFCSGFCPRTSSFTPNPPSSSLCGAPQKPGGGTPALSWNEDISVPASQGGYSQGRDRPTEPTATFPKLETTRKIFKEALRQTTLPIPSPASPLAQL